MSNHITLPTEYQNFIHLSRYSRYLPEFNRRETWNETVSRYMNFFHDHLKETHDYDIDAKTAALVEDSILSLKVMPSMRCLMAAGVALKRENAAGYNCSFVAINRQQAFDEILYILMNGVGVGFSVERQHIANLPTVAEEFHKSEVVIQVADSKLGWARAYKELIAMLYSGQIPKWDVTKVRPAGSVLKTFGGRASGPEPLTALFKFTVATFIKAAGRKLNSIECHDIVCKIAEIVVVGGVRRSALISLSNLSDDRMRNAKSGQWWNEFPHRALANNSAAYSEKPDIGIFMEEWLSLYHSKSGERGFFNREGVKKILEKNGRRNANFEFGTNPCSEIILRDRQFCNLSEVVVRAEDTLETLKEKVKVAVIIGTWQSTLTNFKYLSKKWAENCEEERLLGVSLTGVMDNELTNGKRGDLAKLLETLKEVAIETNAKLAKEMGINQSVAITCNKPSGTVSQLVDAASGIHARWSPYYIRTVRSDMKDPLAKFMVAKGFPVEPDVMKKDTTWVFSFPVKAPEGSVYRNDMTAIEQLELWKVYQDHWCEHKPSVTIYVKEQEWIQVASWVYDNFDYMSGVSFLPTSDHIYEQAPYQDIDEAEYKNFLNKMPKGIDWSELAQLETEDNTIGSQTLACAAGGCEI